VQKILVAEKEMAYLWRNDNYRRWFGFESRKLDW